MEPEGSLSYLQDPATSPYSEKDPVHAPPSPPTHFKSHRTTLIFSPHLRLGLSSSSFPQVSPPIQWTHPSLFHRVVRISPSHSSWVDLSNRTWWRVKTIKFFVMHPRTSSFIGPNIFLCLCSSPNVRDQVSDPNTTGKLTVHYTCILVFIFVDSRLEDMWFCTEW